MVSSFSLAVHRVRCPLRISTQAVCKSLRNYSLKARSVKLAKTRRELYPPIRDWRFRDGAIEKNPIVNIAARGCRILALVADCQSFLNFRKQQKAFFIKQFVTIYFDGDRRPSLGLNSF